MHSLHSSNMTPRHAQMIEGEGVGPKGTAARPAQCARLDPDIAAFSKFFFGNGVAPYARGRVERAAA